MAIILVDRKDTFKLWRDKQNQLSLNFGDFDLLLSSTGTLVNAVNENFLNIGDLTLLTTDDKGDLVEAVNEVDLHTDINTINIGDLALLTTFNKSDLVSAINELDTDIGHPPDLTTTDKSSLVAAVNEIDAEIGDLSLLHTDDKTGLVPAINEVHDEVTGEFGILADLLTTNQDSILDAVNELKTGIGDPTTLTTTATDLSDAVNELDSEIGDLSALTPTANTDLVVAINEVDANCDLNTTNIGTMVDLNTVATNLVEAINESIDIAIAMAIALG